MHTPVDKSAASGNSLCCKVAAKTGNAAAGPEGAVNVVDVAEFSVFVHFIELFNGSVVSVADTDIEHLAHFVSHLFHFLGKSIVYCDGLFAKNMLSRTQCIHCYGIVRKVGCEYPHCINFGVSQCYVVVCDYVFNLGEIFL